MESHEETGCQAPEGPIYCINNCGFFGAAATMNMCSKCHKSMMMKQQQAELAASSIENIVNGKDPIQFPASKPKSPPSLPSIDAPPAAEPDPKEKEGPNRCSTCRKRVGLTGFTCKCGDLFCSVHRYSDKHGCKFDYRTAARDAIATANPVVKAEKLGKI